MAAVQLRFYCLLPELASHGHRTPALVHPDQQANPRHNQTGAVQLARPGPHTSLAHVLRHRGSRRQAAVQIPDKQIQVLGDVPEAKKGVQRAVNSRRLVRLQARFLHDWLVPVLASSELLRGIGHVVDHRRIHAVLAAGLHNEELACG